MQRCFIVTEACPLYVRFYERREFEEKATELYHKFQERFAIESDNFLPGEKRFGIIPSPRDEEKFNSQFMRKVLSQWSSVVSASVQDRASMGIGVQESRACKGIKPESGLGSQLF